MVIFWSKSKENLCKGSVHVHFFFNQISIFLKDHFNYTLEYRLVVVGLDGQYRVGHGLHYMAVIK